MNYMRAKFSSKHGSSTENKSSTLKNPQSIENSILIWLIDDTFRAENSESVITEYIKLLRSIVHNVQTFADKQECLEFIQNIKTNAIFLIVSDTELHGNKIRTLHDFSTVEVIYVLSSEVIKMFNIYLNCKQPS